MDHGDDMRRFLVNLVLMRYGLIATCYWRTSEYIKRQDDEIKRFRYLPKVVLYELPSTLWRQDLDFLRGQLQAKESEELLHMPRAYRGQRIIKVVAPARKPEPYVNLPSGATAYRYMYEF